MLRPETLHHHKSPLQTAVPLEDSLDLDFTPGGPTRVLHVEAEDGGADYRVTSHEVLHSEVLDAAPGDHELRHCHQHDHRHHQQSRPGGQHL